MYGKPPLAVGLKTVADLQLLKSAFFFFFLNLQETVCVLTFSLERPRAFQSRGRNVQNLYKVSGESARFLTVNVSAQVFALDYNEALVKQIKQTKAVKLQRLTKCAEVFLSPVCNACFCLPLISTEK